jgi:hypothetical protein
MRTIIWLSAFVLRKAVLEAADKPYMMDSTGSILFLFVLALCLVWDISERNK